MYKFAEEYVNKNIIKVLRKINIKKENIGLLLWRSIEKLISSLDKPDPEIEKSWVKEAEARFFAYEKGNLKIIPFEDVVKNLKRR